MITKFGAHVHLGVSSCGIDFGPEDQGSKVSVCLSVDLSCCRSLYTFTRWRDRVPRFLLDCCYLVTKQVDGRGYSGMCYLYQRCH